MLGLTIFYFYCVSVSLHINLSLCVVWLLVRSKMIRYSFVSLLFVSVRVTSLICVKVFVCKVYLYALSLSSLLRISPIFIPSNSGHLVFHKTCAKHIFFIQIFYFNNHIRLKYHNCPLSRIQIMLGLTIFYFCSVSVSLCINLSLCVVWLLIRVRIFIPQVCLLFICVCVTSHLCWNVCCQVYLVKKNYAKFFCKTDLWKWKIKSEDLIKGNCTLCL